MYTINSNKCIGCEICKDECPVQAIQRDGDVCVIVEETCIGCGNCAETCPMEAPEEKDE